MAGFFGLFRSKTKYIDEPNSGDESASSQDSFYLGDDDAKSLGNPEYIRKAMARKKTTEKPSSSIKSETISSNNVKRSVDTNMDVFRKMAKDIKK